MSTIRLGAISLDCADPLALGAFWADLLDGEVLLTHADISVVQLGDLLLTAMKVDAYLPPTWPDGLVPKQLHFDLAVDDLDATEQRAVDLGAARASLQPEPDGHRILLDPAGHPFCLSLATNFPS